MSPELELAGHRVENHFGETTGKVGIGKGGQRVLLVRLNRGMRACADAGSDGEE